jgi:hypothetical protein
MVDQRPVAGRRGFTIVFEHSLKRRNPQADTQLSDLAWALRNWELMAGNRAGSETPSRQLTSQQVRIAFTE